MPEPISAYEKNNLKRQQLILECLSYAFSQQESDWGWFDPADVFPEVADLRRRMASEKKNAAK